MRKVITSTVAYILMVFINYMANAIPLNGQTTGEVANRIEVLFTPAGYVFSIWGLIYALLGFWIVRQWFGYWGERSVVRSVRPLFVLSCIFNSLWIVLWHYEYFHLTVIIMVALLVTLIGIYTRVRRLSESRLERTAFSIYLGWISVATIANVSYLLVHIGWGQLGFTAVTWTIIMLIVAYALAGIFVVNYRDWAFALVFVWAFVGIGMQNYQNYNLAAITALSFAALLLIFMVTYRFRWDT